MGWTIVIDDDDDFYKNENCCTMKGMMDFTDFANKHRKAAPYLAEVSDILFANASAFDDIVEDINRVTPQATSDVMPILDNIVKAIEKAEYYIDIVQ